METTNKVSKVSICSASLLDTGNCENCSADVIKAFTTGIPHSEACKEGRWMSFDRYESRYGDICCCECHTPVAWSAALVDSGVYGADTPTWIARQVADFESRL
jgi:hypothetical protein